MAFLSNFSDTWKQLVDLVIRPPRFQYDPNRDLGPRRFQFRGRHIIREDLELVNPRGFVLKCSHYQPVDPEHIRPGASDAEVLRSRQKPKPCVIYCHGNAGSRVDAAMMLHGLLPHNISVFAFDFGGAGQSEGKYLSLGYYEKGDLATVVNHLRESGHVSRIGLWGHSMGAATCILYTAGGGDAFVTSMVLDSAFSSLETIMSEVAANAKKKLAFDGMISAVPDFFISMALSFMRKSIQSQANFDIREVHPLSKVQRLLLPAIFAHGDKDEICGAHHVDLLYDNYAGDKTLFKFTGDHNSPRPDIMHEMCSAFFVATLEGNRGDVFLYRSPSANPGGASGLDQRSFLGKGFSSGSETKEGFKGNKAACFHTGRSAATLALLVSLCPCCTASNKQLTAPQDTESKSRSRRSALERSASDPVDAPSDTTPSSAAQGAAAQGGASQGGLAQGAMGSGERPVRGQMAPPDPTRTTSAPVGDTDKGEEMAQREEARERERREREREEREREQQREDREQAERRQQGGEMGASGVDASDTAPPQSHVAERRAAKLAELDELKREMRSMEAELKARAARRELTKLQQQATSGTGGATPPSDVSGGADIPPQNHHGTTGQNHQPSAGLGGILSVTAAAAGNNQPHAPRQDFVPPSFRSDGPVGPERGAGVERHPPHGEQPTWHLGPPQPGHPPGHPPPGHPHPVGHGVHPGPPPGHLYAMPTHPPHNFLEQGPPRGYGHGYGEVPPPPPPHHLGGEPRYGQTQPGLGYGEPPYRYQEYAGGR